MYQLGCFQKPLPSLLESSGNSLFHNKSQARQAPGLVSSELRLLATLSSQLDSLLAPASVVAPSSGWFRAICYGIQKKSETSTGVDCKQGWGSLRERKGGMDVRYTANGIHYSSLSLRFPCFWLETVISTSVIIPWYVIGKAINT